MAANAPAATAGRPRDQSIDRRVLDATRALLAESGFEGATVQAIAARAGVHASAVYRRWASRVEIVEQVAFPGLEASAPAPTGDLRRDLRRFLRRYDRMLREPAARAAIPALLALYQAGRDTPAGGWLPVSLRPRFREILEAAGPSQVDPDVDPEDVFDVLLGAILARILVPTVARRERPIERLVDAALRLLQPHALDTERQED